MPIPSKQSSCSTVVEVCSSRAYLSHRDRKRDYVQTTETRAPSKIRKFEGCYRRVQSCPPFGMRSVSTEQEGDTCYGLILSFDGIPRPFCVSNGRIGGDGASKSVTIGPAGGEGGPPSKLLDSSVVVRSRWKATRTPFDRKASVVRPHRLVL